LTNCGTDATHTASYVSNLCTHRLSPFADLYGLAPH
jgi:hypothetical protein